MQIRSTKVFYFEKYFENTILICIFKILFRSILHITDQNWEQNVETSNKNNKEKTVPVWQTYTDSLVAGSSLS